MEEEIKKIFEAMADHVEAKGGFPNMILDYSVLWCSDGQAATMIEFLVRQLAEVRLRLLALERHAGQAR